MDINVINRVQQDLQRVANSGSGLLGISTGFKVLDEMTCGLEPGQLVTLGGTSGMGKTSLLLSMLIRMGEAGVPSMILSSEMKAADIARRVIAQMSGIPLQKLRNGHLEPKDWTEMESKREAVERLPIHVSSLTRLHVDQVASEVRDAVRKFGVRVVAIDYVQAMFNDSGRNWESRYAEINMILRELKSLAMDQNVTLLLLSQLSKSALSREDGNVARPRITDLRDSGTIAEDSDVVLLVHRPECYGITMDVDNNDIRGMAEVIVAKQRNGSGGMCKMFFRADILRFEDWHQERDNSSSSVATEFDVPCPPIENPFFPRSMSSDEPSDVPF